MQSSAMLMNRPRRIYLGVIGVHPTLQGRGAGKALLEAFCAPSCTHCLSSSVYLDTTSQPPVLL